MMQAVDRLVLVDAVVDEVVGVFPHALVWHPYPKCPEALPHCPARTLVDGRGDPPAVLAGFRRRRKHHLRGLGQLTASELDAHPWHPFGAALPIAACTGKVHGGLSLAGLQYDTDWRYGGRQARATRCRA